MRLERIWEFVLVQLRSGFRVGYGSVMKVD